MLVLVATNDLQGVVPSDRNFAVEGELVVPVIDDCLDTQCDVCRRVWFGLASHGGTTTAMVAHRPGVTEADLKRAIHDWLDCQGTIDLIVQFAEEGEDPVAEVEELIDDHLAVIRTICETFPAGTVLSRLGDLVSERVTPLAA